IDSGSTHSFIHEDLARQTQLRFEPRCNVRATVAHGESIRCAGVAAEVPLEIGKYRCYCTLYLLPLAGYSGILGYDWLKRVGPVKWNFEAKTLEFEQDGEFYRL
ncbi:hypothetical protein M569_16424, partial [Genlisea aurea]